MATLLSGEVGFKARNIANDKKMTFYDDKRINSTKITILNL